MEFTEILNELYEIKAEIFELGFTNNKENENYNKVVTLVDRLHTTHNDIYENNMHQQKKIKFLIDWLKEEKEVKK